MNELFKKGTVEDLLNARNDVKNRIIKIRTLIEQIEKIQTAFVKWSFTHDVSKCDYRWERCCDKVDYSFWIELSHDLTHIMSKKNHNQFVKMMGDKTPEFNIEQINAFAQNINRLYSENYEQTIKEVYNSLICCSYGTWQNQKKDNLREIKSSFRCSGPIYWDKLFNRFLYRDYYYSSGINYEDLYLVCNLLDGKGRSDYSDNFSVLADEVLKNKSDTVITKYFSVKCYLNGNQLVKWNKNKEHIRILLNQIGSGKRDLPDTMKKRYKPEHFDDK